MVCLLGLLLGGPLAAAAQERPTRAEVWDLKLGLAAETLPDGFAEYACGSNGGPPGVPLAGWRDFRRCRAEPSGLHEVYFRYDDELEYWAKANNFTTEIEQFSGTKVYEFPVVLSALFDARGVLAGLRIVSDPRDTTRRREDAHALRNFITARFGRDGWACTDHPARPTARRRCCAPSSSRTAASRSTASEMPTLLTRFLRKKGQSRVSTRAPDRETEGQFESTVRFELMR